MNIEPGHRVYWKLTEHCVEALESVLTVHEGDDGKYGLGKVVAVLRHSDREHVYFVQPDGVSPVRMLRVPPDEIRPVA